MNKVKVGNIEFGGGKLVLLAGPCVLEGFERSLKIGRRAKEIADKLDIPYIFKASFDKANRSSIKSYRGPGMIEGLKILAEIKRELNVPIVTDIHETYQAVKSPTFCKFPHSFADKPICLLPPPKPARLST